MCGLAGILRFDDHYPDARILQRMSATMQPRGPDGSGLTLRNQAGFAHRRLKIIDLTYHGAQPMYDPQLNLELVFNGCIYNYQELRRDLEQRGYTFFSHSDTEVILKAWHAWGEDCVQRFNGMFAFVIYNQEHGDIHLVRDRLGIKPLYYSLNARELRFASTLPAIMAGGDLECELDPVALNLYMNFHAVVPAPYTLFKAVRKLAPASIMHIKADGSSRTRQYWQLNYTHNHTQRVDEHEAVENLLSVMRRAVNRRMVADVPVGVLLSGGVDSSLIVGLLAEQGQHGLSTFSVGFETVGDEVGDEFQYSDVIAQHFATDHHRIRVNTRDKLLPSLARCFGAMSEPMVSHDVIGFFLLSQKVSQHLKVVQSGQGADEIFGGYHWYPPLVNSSDPVADYSRAFRDRNHDDYRRLIHPRYHGEDHAHALIHDHFNRPGADDPVDKALRLDTTVMLVDDPVKRVDNMTMAWALEARVPFLDHEVVEYAATLPADLKLREGGKYILKQAARQVIPAAVIDRPKGYFPVPALKHLQGDVLELVSTVLSNEAARARALYQPQEVQRLLAAPHEHITPLRGSKLWQLFVLEYWLQVHGYDAT